MPTCSLCKTSFPNRVKIDGKEKNLHSRKYCLDCSPYGSHNTKTLKKVKGVVVDAQDFVCECGETNPDNFYSRRKSSCKTCHRTVIIKRIKKQKGRIVEHFGGECQCCGYNRYYGALVIHHLDPTKKDKNFIHVTGWSWKRILKEIETCVLLCNRCHAEVHAGVRKIRLLMPS